MVERLVDAIVDYQIKNGSLNDSERSVYLYGYTLLLEKVINIIVALLICVVSGRWIEVGLLLLCIMPLRSYAGGWHAKKFLNCTFISNSIIIVGLLFYKFLHLQLLYYFFIETVIFAIIIYMAPVQHNSRVLSDNERRVYKRNCLLIWGIECIAIAWLIHFTLEKYALIILYSHLMVSVALIMGKPDRTTRK